MSTRRTRERKDKNADVFEALKAAREGKGMVPSEYQVGADEEDVYDEVTQKEYEQLVAQRREMDDFVVDDDGLYADDGEEFWDDDAPNKNQRKQQRKLGKRGNRPRVKKAAEIKKIDARFLRGGTTAAQASLDVEAEEDAMLDKLLEGMEEDDDEEIDDVANMAAVTNAKLQDMAIFAPQSKIGDVNEVENEIEKLASTIQRHNKRKRQVGEPASERGNDNEISEMIEDDNEDQNQDSDGEDCIGDNVPAPHSGDDGKGDDGDDDDNYAEGNDDKAEIKTAGGLEGNDGISAAGKKKATSSTSGDIPRAAVASSSSSSSSYKLSAAFDKVTASSDKTLMRDGGLFMYYYDSYFERYAEDDRVYLFGKAIIGGGNNHHRRKSVSVCLTVENMERNIYVLPRKYFQTDPNDPTTATKREVSIVDVYKEIAAIFKRKGISPFKSKKVERNFCFEQPRVTTLGDKMSGEEVRHVPAVAPNTAFLKVVYSFKFPALPRDLKGQTFECVFGTGSSQLELLLLKRELMGPCWLRIEKPERCAVSDCLSWCKYEFKIKDHKLISRLPNPQPPAPPFSITSLAIKTRLNPVTHGHEVAVVSLRKLKSTDVDGPLPARWQLESEVMSMACKLEGKAWPYDLLVAERRHRAAAASSSGKKKGTVAAPKIIKHPNERALLNFLANKIHSWDPDIIVAHELHGFVIDVLIGRMAHHKVQYWSRLGRLRKSRFPRSSARGGLSLVDFGVGSGRLLVDTQVCAKEFVRENTYTLSHLAKTRLNEYRQEIGAAEVEKAYASGDAFLKVVGHTEEDSELTLRLADALQAIPLTKQLTSISGNQWSRSLRSARAERVEYLLLHRFHRLKYIVPEKLTGRERREKMAKKNKELGLDNDGDNKNSSSSKKRRKKPKYEGGLVLEPKKGFYDKYVLLLDFNSLYPSIILEFDLCFTTVRHWEPLSPGEQASLPLRDKDHRGILPKVIKQLLSRRRVVKKLMKQERNPAKKKVLDIRQKAIKLVANSMYGCLGFSSSRFFCQPLASLITSQGRSILERTKQLAESSLSLEVIYGDTDSIMIYTDSEDYEGVMRLGGKVKAEVNKLYRDLTIDIDGVYKKMLLLRKKKYAALAIERNPDGLLEATKETKGLDLVRRDWSQLSKSTGNFVLDRILSGDSREEVVDKILTHLQEVKEQVQARKIPLGRFVITKGLTKHPNDYPDAKSQPHVMVAKRMLAASQPVRVGAYIPYIVCEGDKAVAQRSFHIDEVRKSAGELKVDSKWYLSNQVFPPIARLCAPIKEIAAAQIAESLGLDGKKYLSYDRSNDGGGGDDVIFATTASIQDDADRFKSCESLKLPCKCGVHRKFDGIFDLCTSSSSSSSSSFSCPTSGCDGMIGKDREEGTSRAMNAIASAARKHLLEYHEGWFQCKNPVCRRLTRTMPLGSAKCRACHEGLERKSTEANLYTQLVYFQSLFDMERAQKKLEAENKERKEKGKEELKLDLKPDEVAFCNDLHRFVTDRYINKNGFNYINLGALFTSIFG